MSPSTLDGTIGGTDRALPAVNVAVGTYRSDSRASAAAGQQAAQTTASTTAIAASVNRPPAPEPILILRIYPSSI